MRRFAMPRQPAAGHYLVTPLRRAAGARASLIATSAQSSAPAPGPTLALQLGARSRARRFVFTARVVVEASGASRCAEGRRR